MIYKLVEPQEPLTCYGCVFRGGEHEYRACNIPKGIEPCGEDIYVIGEIKNV